MFDCKPGVSFNPFYMIGIPSALAGVDIQLALLWLVAIGEHLGALGGHLGVTEGHLGALGGHLGGTGAVRRLGPVGEQFAEVFLGYSHQLRSVRQLGLESIARKGVGGCARELGQLRWSRWLFWPAETCIHPTRPQKQ